MGNTCNGSDNKLKKETENKNIIVKNFVNFYPKISLNYIGSKNQNFFFGSRNSFKDVIKLIVIQQQFSLRGQLKIIKKWYVDFRKIAFINESHEFIALCENEIQKWGIDCCYNLIKNFTTLLFFPKDSRDFPLIFFKDSFQLQLGIQDDWIVAAKQRKILFLQKEMEGKWNLIHQMYIDFVKFILNELGNILIILLNKNFEINSNPQFYLVIYLKNTLGQLKNIKEIEAYKHNFYYCFIDNEKFAVFSYNIITIWQVVPSKQEVIQLQQLKLNLNGMLLYGMHFMKQMKILLVQTRFAIYFIKKINEIFYFTQYVEIQKDPLVTSSEGFLFNFFDQARSRRIEIFQILEN